VADLNTRGCRASTPKSPSSAPSSGGSAEGV
jgi:hypothetical protein